MVNFQDDFLGFADEGDELLDHYEEFLRMCKKTGVKLNPTKVKVGVEHAKFYGYELSKRGMHPAEANLDPIRKLVAPTNRKEVRVRRSLLGLFVQFRQFYERYDRIVKPIQKLLRKNEAFAWGKEQEQALKQLKAGILKPNVYLAVPRKDVPLILETDGSDDGWGAILLQVIDGKRRIIVMWSKQWQSVAMQKTPPYYKETKAWMNDMTKPKIYIDTHPLPVQCVTDHILLTWVKHTSGKGPVSQFILDTLGQMDYEIKYRPGQDLVEADAASRYPCLGPKMLSKGGTRQALQTLLHIMPKNWLMEERWWVHTGKGTALDRELVQSYLSELPTRGKRRVPATDRPTVDKVINMYYGMTILIPPAETDTQVLQALIRKNKPFALLMPLSLLHKTKVSNEEKAAIQKAAKHVLAGPELTWVIHRVPGVENCRVYRRKLPYFGPEPDMIGIMSGPPDFDTSTWPEEQRKLILKHSNLYKGKVCQSSSKFLYFCANLANGQVGLPPNKKPETQNTRGCPSPKAKQGQRGRNSEKT